jgi:VWFA-related protein
MSVQMRWRYSFYFIFTLAFGSYIFGQTENGKPEAQTEGSFNLHVDVDLVTTDITVTGTSIPEFQANDFVIYDNDVAQPLSYFSHDQLPIAIALLIDSSGSIENHLNELQIAALTALRRLKPEDQVALYSFTHKYWRLSELTEDWLHIAKLISHIESKDGTDIYGTLQNATRYLKKAAPRRRRAIILISDNCHNKGKFNSDKIRTELLESATTLYNIVTPSPETEWPPCVVTNAAMQRIAVESGGEVMDVRSSMSLKSALESAISRIRMQYTLGFNPSDPGPRGTYHRLKIRFANRDRCSNCRIIGRSGYYSGVAVPVALPEKEPMTLGASSQSSDESLVQRIILIAGTSSPDLNEIPFTVSTEQIDSGGKAELKLNLQIEPSAIEFPMVKDRRAYKVIAAILHADEKGNVKGHETWKLEDYLDEQEYSRLTKEGIRFNTAVTVPPQNPIIKIVVYDESSGRISSRFLSGSSGRQRVH